MLPDVTPRIFSAWKNESIVEEGDVIATVDKSERLIKGQGFVKNTWGKVRDAPL